MPKRPDMSIHTAENAYFETLALLGHQLGLPYNAGATHSLLYLEARPLSAHHIAQRLDLNDREVESALKSLKEIAWVWRTPKGLYHTHKDPTRLLRHSLDHVLNKHLLPIEKTLSNSANVLKLHHPHKALQIQKLLSAFSRLRTLNASARALSALTQHPLLSHLTGHGAAND